MRLNKMENQQTIADQQEQEFKQRIEEMRESHWIRYCTECPEDIACKDYEI